ncbi:GMP reductase [Candidatus Terasakiella magnetica]|uniref:GMP reductase n=1 Tax=Candidatus Terasakiella magnetica TaxID=1867952 RepID=A0A1C3RHM7_9PROT|nr:GMP reductase [Candidatus Terasakiella magnetica]SCA56779.1 GMP reductase [Candidatus Terasakiella magnetica]
MRIDTEVKLDYKNVLIRPKRSYLHSRSEVDMNREFRFPHAPYVWKGVPIIAANMDTVGTFKMAKVLAEQGAMTALHKFYGLEDYEAFVKAQRSVEAENIPLEPELGLNAWNSTFFSFGITEKDSYKLDAVMKIAQMRPEGEPVFICLDVANGYSERFARIVEKIRKKHANTVIMAGNVVTGEMTEELILSGADIVKVGIGPGSVCTTRKMTGVGFPQLSAVIECADAAHGLKGLVCADGGCTVAGDVAKAFAAGADFVMLGGMLAGHDESEGTVQTRRFLTHELDENDKQVVKEEKYVEFYGMSSDTAMNKHYGGVAKYRASEGKRVEIPYRGPVEGTIMEILGGVRSTCTYVGAQSLKELSKRTTFVMVSQQINEVFGKS